MCTYKLSHGTPRKDSSDSLSAHIVGFSIWSLIIEFYCSNFQNSGVQVKEGAQIYGILESPKYKRWFNLLVSHKITRLL